ncbi:hypothetical protein ON010_g10168 [Phytophthora cinnamomi]|nr:hypothetical protein ON010_g10168 [Phytophthora cinnamomi]
MASDVDSSRPVAEGFHFRYARALLRAARIISSDIEDLAEFMPSPAANRRLEALLVELADIESVPNADIVAAPDFEDGVVKVLGGRVKQLSWAEKAALRPFEREARAAADATKEKTKVGFADRILKRRKVQDEASAYQNQVLPPLDELFHKELRMDMNNKDITARVTSYFMSCNTLIKTYRFTRLLEEEKGSKKKLELLSKVVKLYNPICQQALDEATERRALAREKISTRVEQTTKEGYAVDCNRSGTIMMVHEQFRKACPEAERVVRLKKSLVCKGADGKQLE